MSCFTKVVLELGQGGGVGWVRRRISLASGVEVFAAREHATSLEALHVQTSVEALDELPAWPQSQGIDVGVTVLDEGNRRLHLQLRDTRYREVFGAFCDDLGSVLDSQSIPRDAVVALHSRMVKWQFCLGSVGPSGLSSEAQLGLWGELYVLERYIMASVGVTSAMAAWRGPYGADQDFQLVGLSCEVKSTQHAVPERIHISNLRQLDQGGGPPIILVLLVVDSKAERGRSLFEIVDAIRCATNGSDREAFEEALRASGYLDVHAARYRSPRYRLAEARPYAVGSDFPLLRVNDMPLGVLEARYKISVPTIQPYQISEQLLGRRLSAAADGDAND